MPAFFRRKTVWFAAVAVIVLGGGAFVLTSQAKDKKEAEAAQPAKAAPFRRARCSPGWRMTSRG